MIRPLAPHRLAIVLAFSITGISRVEASPSRSTVEYSTSGSIGTTSIAGAPEVRFEGIGDGSVTLPNSFRTGEIPVAIPAGYGSAASLGSFVASTPPGDGVTIYSHTPFEIDLRIRSIDGASPVSGQDLVVIRGWLDGTLAGASPSGLTASYRLAGSFGVPWEPRDLVGDVQAGLSTLSLTIPRVRTILNIPSYQASMTDVSAMLVTNSPLPSPAPEPGTVLVLLGGIAIWAWRRKAGVAPRR